MGFRCLSYAKVIKWVLEKEEYEIERGAEV